MLSGEVGKGGAMFGLDAHCRSDNVDFGGIYGYLSATLDALSKQY